MNLSIGGLGVYGEKSTSLMRFLSDLCIRKILISLCAKYVMSVLDAHTTYFIAGIKDGAALSFSISN